MTEPPPPADDIDARTAAADALRRLGHALISREADPDLLRRIAGEAEAIAVSLEARPRRERDVVRLKHRMWDTPPPDGGPMAHFDECVVSGPANPMGIGMQVRRVEDHAVADVTFGAAFEGAPRRAHGGAVAAVMDDIMGYVLMLQRTPAYTGRLSISYRAPTPVETRLVADAWMEARDGRKLALRATLSDPDGELIAEGEGLFIAIPPERFTDAGR